MALKIHPEYIFRLKRLYWPQYSFYDKQVEVVESVFTNRETYVTAGNQLGKDFAAGFIAPAAFVACQILGITCRIVTTSVAEHHLKVLWGEIGRFMTTSAIPLIGNGDATIPMKYNGKTYPIKHKQFTMNYQEVRRSEEAQSKNPINYLVGRVSAQGEGLAGHHAEWTLLIGDEASGLDNEVHKMAQGWAKHMLFIGNPNPCNNFFKENVKAGDLLEPSYLNGKPS